MVPQSISMPPTVSQARASAQGGEASGRSEAVSPSPVDAVRYYHPLAEVWKESCARRFGRLFFRQDGDTG